MAPFYSQPSLHVEIYAARSENLPVVEGDIEFYQELARSAPGPVLELGCGTGRVAIPLAQARLDVTGLDLSPAMLAVARERAEAAGVAPRFVYGDMTGFDLGRQFGLVYIAFRSFMMVTTTEGQRASLECIGRHLVPGGTLVIDVFDPLLHRMGNGQMPEAWRAMDDVVHPTSWNTVRIEVNERTADAVAQTFEETWRFAECASDGTVLREEEEVLRMRWTYRHELRYLLELAGLEFVAEYSDYEKSPPEYGKEILVVARKPG